MIEDGDDLPQWCQYKAAQAQQMVGSVRDYLEYKLERMGDDLVGEEEMFDPEEMEEDFGEDSADTMMDIWHEDEDEDSEDEMSYDVEMPDDFGYDGADVQLSLEKDEDE